MRGFTSQATGRQANRSAGSWRIFARHLHSYLGKSKLEKELQGLSFAPDLQPVEPGDFMLRGVPQALADQVSEIRLEVTPEHRIVRIVIDDVDGSSTEYRFSDQKENGTIAESQFRFTPPPGTETVEGSLEP